MGYKENINQNIWGNPDNISYLDYENYNLKTPRKDTWLGGNKTAQTISAQMNYANLMRTGDLPVEIDETICPWGINANSGIGNYSVLSAYKQGNNYIPVKSYMTQNTAKGQKPVYFTWGSFKAYYANVTQEIILTTIGYLQHTKETEGFSEKVPNKRWGYSFVNNLKYSNITVLPVIIATNVLKEGVITDTGVLGKYSGGDYYNSYPNQPQFTVWEYFNGSDSEGIPYTEKYPQILGVYACIFYQTDNDNKDKIPNLSLNVFSDITEKQLEIYYGFKGFTPYTVIPYPDYFETSGNTDLVNRPHYLTVLGHLNNQHTAHINSSNYYPNCDYYNDENEAIEGAVQTSNRYYFSYIIPEKLQNNFKMSIGRELGYMSIGWYEGLTEDECYRHIAYTGLPFFAGEMIMSEAVNHIVASDNTTPEFRHSLMYPDFSRNMVTTGTYSPYATSESPLKNITWLFDITEDYDPEYKQEGDESGDNYEKRQNDRGKLTTTYHSNANMDGFTAYVLSGKGLQTVKNIINAALKPPADVSTDDWIKLDWYGQDPASFILAVNRFPCDIQQIGASKQITIGRTPLTTGDTPLYAATPNLQLQRLDFGTLQITPYFNNFLDYAPYSNYTIHIPYLSDYALDPKIWLNHSCSIKIDYDIVSCNAMVEIWRDDMWYDTIYGNFGNPIPFLVYNTGGFQNAIINAQANLDSAKNVMTQSYLSTATSVVSTGLGIATGNVPLTIGSGVNLARSITQPFDTYNRVQNAEYNIKHTAPNPTGTSGIGGVTTLTTRNYCTLIISRPQPLHYDKTMYGKTIGFACCETGRLNSYHGLTVCSNTRFNSFTGTQSELAEIQQLLNTGVILP